MIFRSNFEAADNDLMAQDIKRHIDNCTNLQAFAAISFVEDNGIVLYFKSILSYLWVHCQVLKLNCSGMYLTLKPSNSYNKRQYKIMIEEELHWDKFRIKFNSFFKINNVLSTKWELLNPQCYEPVRVGNRYEFLFSVDENSYSKIEAAGRNLIFNGENLTFDVVT